MLEARLLHTVTVPDKRNRFVRTCGDSANLRTEEQIVDHSQDHGKMIADMLIRTAAVPPFYKNGYVVSCAETREGVVIDPGDEAGELIAAVKADGVKVKAIL